jgi:hypothetical protein
MFTHLSVTECNVCRDCVLTKSMIYITALLLTFIGRVMLICYPVFWLCNCHRLLDTDCKAVHFFHCTCAISMSRVHFIKLSAGVGSLLVRL